MQEALKELIRDCNLTILKWKENSRLATGKECYVTINEIRGMVITKIRKLIGSNSFQVSRWRIKNDLIKSIRIEIDHNQFIKFIYLIDHYDEPFLKNVHLNLMSIDYKELNPVYKEDTLSISLDTIDFRDIQNIKF